MGEPKDDQTPLHYAAFYGHLEVVQFLVEHGVPLDAPDKASTSTSRATYVLPFTAMKQCKAPVAELTLSWAIRDCLVDADLDEQDNKTAYQIAKDKHKQKCVQFLKSWYETSQKFVHAAEEGDDEEIARIIAEINGTYPLRYMRDKFGRNALHSAALGGNKECAFWLIRKARDASEFLSLTLVRWQNHWMLSVAGEGEAARCGLLGMFTNKSPSRCAFEAGHSSLANYLQAWEEGNDDYSTNDEATPSTLEYDGSRAVGEDEDNSAPRGRNIDTVYNWLKFFKMDEYTRNFEKDGFDTLRGVATIDEEDLIDMEVKKGHRRVVLSHIEELRTQLALLDESTQVAGQEPHSSPTLGMLPQITKQSSLSNLITAGGAPAAAVAGSETTPHRTERRGSVSAASMDV
ncbi:hypothetical protein BBJ28_00010185 [Nothophytophthora sp. Chile5]|nr:hypothetical protein BBJ28_00010185 [Nothophytophthora sp. Chile5]